MELLRLSFLIPSYYSYLIYLTTNQIYQKVTQNLNKERLLLENYNIELSDDLIQKELNRIVKDTHKPQKLNKLFSLFHHDPQQIAECFIRPILVDKLISENYYKDKNQFLTIQNEALRTLNNHKNNIWSKNNARLSKSIYQFNSNIENRGLTINEEGVELFSIAESNFKQVLNHFLNDEYKLHETKQAFYFIQIKQLNESIFEKLTYSWQKPILLDWLSKKQYNKNTFVPLNYFVKNISIPEIINNSPSSFTTLMKNPTARVEHTAIWTGNEMIIWGGNDDFGNSDTGGMYNPMTHVWTELSLNNAPRSRVQHTAIWTGTHMIIWGGLHGSNDLNTGALFNPTTNTWTETTTVNSPIPTKEHTAVWSGTEMLVWGGNPSDNKVRRYNPQLNEWNISSGSNAPIATYDHISVWTGTKLIIWGGTLYNTSGGVFDLTNNTWMTTSLLNVAPGRAWAPPHVWTGNEMILWGGGGGNTQNTGSRYNPVSNTWTTVTIANAPEKRVRHTIIWTGTEMIVWGGNFTPGSLNSGARMDGITYVWNATNQTDAPVGRGYHTAVWDGLEMIIWGGATGGFNGTEKLNTGGHYNPVTDTWIVDLIYKNSFE